MIRSRIVIAGNFFLLSALFSLNVSTAVAQTKSAKTARLPGAESILDSSFAAQGSKAAYARIKSMSLQGTVTIVAQKITGTIDTKVKFPDKVYQSQEIKGVGKFESGFDGKVAWSRDPINGLRTLTGPEKTQILGVADEIKSSDWRSQYTEPKMLGIRKVGKVDTYAIQLKSKRSPKPVILFIDVATKLPVRTDMVAVTAQGSVPMQSFASDYRLVEGIKMPFKSRQVAGGGAEALIEFTSVKLNAAINDDIFTKPKDAAKAN